MICISESFFLWKFKLHDMWRSITVFSLISAPGAFEIEKWHCHSTLQLAPPFDINVNCYLTFFTMNITWNIRIIRWSTLKWYGYDIFCLFSMKTLKKHWKGTKKFKIFDNLPFLLPIYQQSGEEKRGGGVNWKGGDKWRKYGKSM